MPVTLPIPSDLQFGEGNSCHIVSCVKCSRSVTSVGVVCHRLLVNMWFLFREVSSFSGCFGWAALFHCDST